MRDNKPQKVSDAQVEVRKMLMSRSLIVGDGSTVFYAVRNLNPAQFGMYGAIQHDLKTGEKTIVDEWWADRIDEATTPEVIVKVD